jgi:signal transduction histidine kinase
MKVRTRSLLILVATLVIFLVALSFITQSVILQSFGAIEKQETSANVQRFVAQLNNEVETVAATSHDWAIRNETAAIFTEKGDVQDPSLYFQPVSMKNLGIDYILIYNQRGQLVFSETIAQDGSAVQNVPADLDPIVRDSILPEGMPGGISGRRGISSIDNDPVILAGYPVTYGNQSDPMLGTLVMARLLDSSRIGDMNQMLQLDGSLDHYVPAPHAGGKLSADEAEAARNGAIIVHSSGESQLEGLAILTGIENKPTFLLLRIVAPRPVYQQVRTSIGIVAGAIIFLSIAFLVAIQFLLQGFILAPLSTLDGGMKSIGKSGDLSQRIPETGDEEIRSLTHSLNKMLAKIESQKLEMQDLLEEIGQQRDTLDDARQELAERNRDLEELNRKANLYLDIYLDAITYEILNAIMGLRGYAELVHDAAGEKERQFAGKIVALAKKSDDVIRNIETISRIYKNPPEVKPVDLASIIKKEMGARAGARIVMENCNRMVLANDMLGVVFDNIFSNSLKFGGKDAEITVSSRDTPEGMLEISVSDNGPGIPDGAKQGIFDRFARDDTKKRSSYGLGLHIVKMLVESYGGTVWAEDRVPGEQKSGASIHFTVKLA